MAKNSMQFDSTIVTARKFLALAKSVSSESRTTSRRFLLRGCAGTICPLLRCIWVCICWLVHPWVWCYAS